MSQSSVTTASIFKFLDLVSDDFHFPAPLGYVQQESKCSTVNEDEQNSKYANMLRISIENQKAFMKTINIIEKSPNKNDISFLMAPKKSNKEEIRSITVVPFEL